MQTRGKDGRFQMKRNETKRGEVLGPFQGFMEISHLVDRGPLPVTLA